MSSNAYIGEIQEAYSSIVNAIEDYSSTATALRHDWLARMDTEIQQRTHLTQRLITEKEHLLAQLQESRDKTSQMKHLFGTADR